MKYFSSLIAVVLMFACFAHAAEDLQYRKDGGKYFMVLKKGQKVIESLMTLAEKEHITGANIKAIGAVANADVGYYDMKKKDYKHKKFAESHEVVSLLGSIGTMDGKPVVHAHIALAGPDLELHGGHLFEAETTATLELFIEPTNSPIFRHKDDEFPNTKFVDWQKTAAAVK